MNGVACEQRFNLKATFRCPKANAQFMRAVMRSLCQTSETEVADFTGRDSQLGVSPVGEGEGKARHSRLLKS